MPSSCVKRSTSVISTLKFLSFEGLGSSPRWTLQCHTMFKIMVRVFRTTWDHGPGWSSLVLVFGDHSGPVGTMVLAGPHWSVCLGPLGTMVLSGPHWSLCLGPSGTMVLGGPHWSLCRGPLRTMVLEARTMVLDSPKREDHRPGCGKNGASSGNRTRATCLEGRYSNHSPWWLKF